MSCIESWLSCAVGYELCSQSCVPCSKLSPVQSVVSCAVSCVLRCSSRVTCAACHVSSAVTCVTFGRCVLCCRLYHNTIVCKLLCPVQSAVSHAVSWTMQRPRWCVNTLSTEFSLSPWRQNSMWTLGGRANPGALEKKKKKKNSVVLSILLLLLKECTLHIGKKN